MGIAGASLYNAFGDKRALYQSSLNRHLEQTLRERIRRLECSLPPREAISAFFREIVDRSLTDKKRRGCVLINSTLENVPDDRDFQQIVATFLSDVESFFQRCAAAGQREVTIGNPQIADRSQQAGYIPHSRVTRHRHLQQRPSHKQGHPQSHCLRLMFGIGSTIRSAKMKALTPPKLMPPFQSTAEYLLQPPATT